MNTRLPTSQEIAELIAFLPLLYAEGFSPIKNWSGKTQVRPGVYDWPYPEYEDVVYDFFQVASNECWTDRDYAIKDAMLMLENHDVDKTVTLSQIKTMLTYCVRKERFSEGHWGEAIEGGYIRRLLESLAKLGSTNT